MIVHTAHLRCKPEAVEAFKQRLRSHAKLSQAEEAGCRCFDVHQNAADPSLFFLHEVYDNADALQVHQNSERFHSFRADVADWVIERQWWFWRSAADE